MIVPKVQKQPKLNKVVASKASAAKTAAAPQASVAKSATLPKVCANSQIRERAFEIFEKRDSRHGHDLQDWFHAERQVLAQ